MPVGVAVGAGTVLEPQNKVKGGILMPKVAVSSAMKRVMSLSGLTDGELVSAGVWYGRVSEHWCKGLSGDWPEHGRGMYWGSSNCPRFPWV